MAIKPDPVPAAAESTVYIPGTENFPTLACVSAGDRMLIQSVRFADENPFNRVEPDASGYLPHLAYYPLNDVNADPRGGLVKEGSVGSNNSKPTPIRVDMGPIYCPWSGNVNVEGGNGPGDPNGRLLITYYWDKPWVERNRNTKARTDQRGLVLGTLTFFGVPATTLIRRPVLAKSVISADSPRLIVLHYGTFSVPVTSSNGRPIPLGGAIHIEPRFDCPALIFEIAT